MLRAVADTHAVIWYIFDDPRLSVAARAAIEGAIEDGDQIGLSSIVLAETIYLAEKGDCPPALKESGAWPLAGLGAALFQGSLTRPDGAEEALRQMLLRAVAQGCLGLGVGKDAARLDRVWFKEEVDPAEIVFDNETHILLPARARQEKAPAPVPPPPPAKLQLSRGDTCAPRESSVRRTLARTTQSISHICLLMSSHLTPRPCSISSLPRSVNS